MTLRAFSVLSLGDVILTDDEGVDLALKKMSNGTGRGLVIPATPPVPVDALVQYDGLPSPAPIAPPPPPSNCITESFDKSDGIGLGPDLTWYHTPTGGGWNDDSGFHSQAILGTISHHLTFALTDALIDGTTDFVSDFVYLDQAIEWADTATSMTLVNDPPADWGWDWTMNSRIQQHGDDPGGHNATYWRVDYHCDTTDNVAWARVGVRFYDNTSHVYRFMQFDQVSHDMWAAGDVFELRISGSESDDSLLVEAVVNDEVLYTVTTAMFPDYLFHWEGGNFPYGAYAELTALASSNATSWDGTGTSPLPTFDDFSVCEIT